MGKPSLVYNTAGPSASEFIQSRHYFTGLQGPVGSGKSSAAVVNVLNKSMLQRPGPDGVARTRWAVLRNTYSELETTTMKTWTDWLPEDQFGKISRQAPFRQLIKLDLGTHQCEIEVLFIALDRADQIGKLLSLELTGAWMNEAREFPKEILDAVTMRVGRFPAVKDGGPSWFGVIADTNAPAEDHWCAIMSEQAPPPEWMSREEVENFVRPHDWLFLSQPPAMLEERRDGKVVGYKINPDRENAGNVVEGYYEKQLQGKTQSWINVYLLNRCDTLKQGRPIYPEYNPEIHKASSKLQYLPQLPIYVGMDFGLTPAAVFAQRARGRWQVLGELVTFNTMLSEFVDELNEYYFKMGWTAADKIYYGDPSGDNRFANTKETTFQLLRQLGITARPTHTNDPQTRWEAVRRPLMRLVDGQPAMVVDPSCTHLHKGFVSSYVFDKDGKALKNDSSHVHDALQYLMLGGGEARQIGNYGRDNVGKPKARVASRQFSVWR